MWTIFGLALLIIIGGSIAVWMITQQWRKDNSTSLLETPLRSDFPSHFDGIDIVQKDFVKLLDAMHQHIVGMDDLLISLSIALLVKWHVLVEWLPGLAKTKTISLFSQMLGLDFARMQFTPDMLPADITGTEIYNDKTKTFQTRYGPLVTNIFLADEINRTTPKVQSALLEAMQEQQITIGGVSKKLPDPFVVLATQNPIEQEWTYILPEAQMDRFLCKVLVDYPNHIQESAMLDIIHDEKKISSLLSLTKLRGFQKEVAAVTISESIKKYIVSLVQKTRNQHNDVLYGSSPRWSICIYHMAQAIAWLQWRDNVEKNDVHAVVLPALRHRLLLSYSAQASGASSDDILRDIFSLE